DLLRRTLAARLLLVLAHQLGVALLVERQGLLPGHLAGEVGREAVGRVQVEDVLAGDPALRLLRPPGRVLEHRATPIDGPPEVALLALDDLGHPDGVYR